MNSCIGKGWVDMHWVEEGEFVHWGRQKSHTEVQHTGYTLSKPPRVHQVMGITQWQTATKTYLYLITLEEVQISFALSWLFTNKGQNGIVSAGLHHSLTVLNGACRKVL